MTVNDDSVWTSHLGDEFKSFSQKNITILPGWLPMDLFDVSFYFIIKVNVHPIIQQLLGKK